MILYIFIPGQEPLCLINKHFRLSHQTVHRPPPGLMKEHHLSPMQEDTLSAPMNEKGSQSAGAGAAGGCPPDTIGSSGINKKPRLRTKVNGVILLFLIMNKKWSHSVIHIPFQHIHPKTWLVHSRFLWRPWASFTASSKMLDYTRTRRLSTPYQHSLTCPNTPSSNSSRTSATMSSTMAASRTWVRGRSPVEVWTLVNTEKRSCFQAQKIQNRVKMELRRSSTLQREMVNAQGGGNRLQAPPLPTPASLS